MALKACDEDDETEDGVHRERPHHGSWNRLEGILELLG